MARGDEAKLVARGSQLVAGSSKLMATFPKNTTPMKDFKGTSNNFFLSA